MKTTFASMIRRPISQKERIAWITLFFIVVVGVRYYTPHFRLVTPVAAPVKPGLQIEDDAKTGLPQSVLHAESVLSFDPAETQIRIGETLTLDAVVETGGNRVSGAELSVQYDPTRLKLEHITPSPAFTLSLQAPLIDNKQGMGSIALGVPLEQSAVGGRQVIAAYSFRALTAVSSTEIIFSDRTLLAANDEPGNVIREKKTARVEITAR
jgi:hypothetical protein